MALSDQKPVSTMAMDWRGLTKFIGAIANCADAPPATQITSKSAFKPSNSFIKAVASSITAMNLGFRWLISAKDTPVWSYSLKLSAASANTEGGIVAGPALKLWISINFLSFHNSGSMLCTPIC